jgi:predicted GNAT family acetyltransferase
VAGVSVHVVPPHGALRVRPLCPFVRAWIEHHPDYRDLTRPR